jgi:hypothetical protein
MLVSENEALESIRATTNLVQPPIICRDPDQAILPSYHLYTGQLGRQVSSPPIHCSKDLDAHLCIITKNPYIYAMLG